MAASLILLEKIGLLPPVADDLGGGHQFETGIGQVRGQVAESGGDWQ